MCFFFLIYELKSDGKSVLHSIFNIGIMQILMFVNHGTQDHAKATCYRLTNTLFLVSKKGIAKASTFIWLTHASSLVEVSGFANIRKVRNI